MTDQLRIRFVFAVCAAVLAFPMALDAAETSNQPQLHRQAAVSSLHRAMQRLGTSSHMATSIATMRGQRVTPTPGNSRRFPGSLNSRVPAPYFVTVYEAQYLRRGESTWRRLGTYETRIEADRALFLAYDRGQIPPGSRMRIVERQRRGVRPPATVTRFFVVYRPPGEGQRELGPYHTRRDAELALFRAVERGQIPAGSRPVIQEREVPVE